MLSLKKQSYMFQNSLFCSTVAALCILGGCTQTAEQPSAYDSAMAQQNRAIQAVQVYKEIPAGALGVRTVIAAACGSDASDSGADENYILTGLKLKAFKSGADGIAQVEIQKQPDPTKHCEVGFSVGGTAKAFSVQR